MTNHRSQEFRHLRNVLIDLTSRQNQISAELSSANCSPSSIQDLRGLLHHMQQEITRVQSRISTLVSDRGVGDGECAQGSRALEVKQISVQFTRWV
jgi:hypothetical protein